MIKQLTLGTILVSAMLLTGCGGDDSSSSSSSSPESTSLSTPTTSPSSTTSPASTTSPSTSSTSDYKTLQDLEYKTLTLEEYWHTIQDTTKNKTQTTMVFKQRYTDGGFLVDEGSNSTSARLCTVLDRGEYNYMCYTGVYKANSSTLDYSYMHVFNIANDNKVTGNFGLSLTADTDELVDLVSTRDKSDAWITGTVSSTSAKATSKLTNSLNKKQLALSKTNAISTSKSTQSNEELKIIVNDMKLEMLNK